MTERGVHCCLRRTAWLMSSEAAAAADCCLLICLLISFLAALAVGPKQACACLACKDAAHVHADHLQLPGFTLTDSDFDF